MTDFKHTECPDDECKHYDPFFDDNCGGQNMENCLMEKSEGGAEVACIAGLGPKHTGCRISAPGILGRIRDGWKLDNGMRYATGEMLKHLEDTAKRFYAGDTKAIDEFLQLYCLDETRP